VPKSCWKELEPSVETAKTALDDRAENGATEPGNQQALAPPDYVFNRLTQAEEPLFRAKRCGASSRSEAGEEEAAAH